MRKLCVLGLAVLAAASGLDAQGTRRTIYVTAQAADGGPLPALTPADLVIKEGGQTRTVIRIEPSRTPLQIAIAVEERLAPDDDVRRSVANFFDHVNQIGKVALYTVGKRS